MADDSLGTLSVNITGDYSELVQAIQDATEAATAGAEQIGQLGEALVGVGEALAITESLKEFGQEALNAFGTVQSVTVGLQQLTGSAQEANDIIEQIKTLAGTEPFAFPEIAPTVQKMVALGVSAEQIPGIMQAAANTAAATGNSFQQVANSIDRISLSGTLSARTLTQLGVSTQQLADIMGVAATQVTAAFKAMDQSQRLEILEEAMQKFAGAAAAQAATISGAWIIFKNQFEEVMVGVGQAIAPVITDILEFGTTVLEEVQAAVNWFNQLPAPVRDTAVAVGIAVAAIAPLAAGLGAVALGVGALSSLLPAAATVLEGFGVIASTTAVAEEGAAAATAAASEAAEAGAAGFSLLGFTLGPVAIGIAAIASAVLFANFTGITSDIKDLGTAFMEVAVPAVKEFASEVSTSFSMLAAETKAASTEAASFITSLTGIQVPVEELTARFPALTDVIKQTAESLTGTSWIPVATAWFGLLSGQIQAMNPAMAQMLQNLQPVPPAFAATAAAGNDLSRALQGLVGQQATANATLAQAKQTLTEAKEALDAGSISAQTYNLAVVAYDKAVLAANPHTKDWSDTLAGVSQASALAAEKEQSLATALQQAEIAFNAGHISANLFIEIYGKAQAAAKAVGDSLDNVAAEVEKVKLAGVAASAAFDTQNQVFSRLKLLYDAGIISLTDLEGGYKKLKVAADAAGKSGYDQATAMLAAVDGASKQDAQLKDNITTLGGLATKSLQTDEVIQAQGNLFKTISSEAAAMGISITDVGGVYQVTAKNITPAVQSIIDVITKWMNQSGLTTAAVQQGFKVVTDATTGIITYKGSVEQATGAVQTHTAAHQALATAVKGTADAFANADIQLQDFTTTTTDAGSTIITFTDGLTAEAEALQKVADAAEDAADAISSLNSTSGVSGGGGGTSQVAGIASLMSMLGAPGSSISAFLGSSGLVQTGIGGSGGAGTNFESVSDYNASIVALAAKLNLTTITTIDQFGNQLTALGPAITSTTTAATSAAGALTATATAATAAAAATAASSTEVATSADAYGDLNDALQAAGLSYSDLTNAQQQEIEQQLQAAAATGTTKQALESMATSLVQATQGTGALATSSTTASSSVGTLANSATAAATQISTAGTQVSNAAVQVAQVAQQAVESFSLPANAKQSGDTTGGVPANATTVTIAGIVPGANGLVGTITPGTGQEVPYNNSQPLQLTVNLNGGVVVGNGGMQQLTQMIQQGVVTQLRQAGAKV